LQTYDQALPGSKGLHQHRCTPACWCARLQARTDLQQEVLEILSTQVPSDTALRTSSKLLQPGTPVISNGFSTAKGLVLQQSTSSDGAALSRPDQAAIIVPVLPDAQQPTATSSGSITRAWLADVANGAHGPGPTTPWGHCRAAAKVRVEATIALLSTPSNDSLYKHAHAAQHSTAQHSTHQSSWTVTGHLDGRGVAGCCTHAAASADYTYTLAVVTVHAVLLGFSLLDTLIDVFALIVVMPAAECAQGGAGAPLRGCRVVPGHGSCHDCGCAGGAGSSRL